VDYNSGLSHIEIMVKLQCPACGENTLDEIEVRNALSRYCKKYICSDCGLREALEGDFWHGKSSYAEMEKNYKLAQGK